VPIHTIPSLDPTDPEAVADAVSTAVPDPVRSMLLKMA
jgi:hypothetical protein